MGGEGGLTGEMFCRRARAWRIAVGPPPTRTDMSGGMLGAPEVVAISPVRADMRFSRDGILPSLRRASQAADQSAEDVACMIQTTIQDPGSMG